MPEAEATPSIFSVPRPICAELGQERHLRQLLVRSNPLANRALWQLLPPIRYCLQPAAERYL